MTKKKVKNIENGIIDDNNIKHNNDCYIPLIDYCRENQLNYSKLYAATLKGNLKSIRKGSRIYIEITSIRNNRRTVL